MIQITKSFELNVTGAYHRYNFQAALSTTCPDDLSSEEHRTLSDELFEKCKNDVYRDLRRMYDTDEDFKVIWIKREESIARERLLLQNTGVLPK